MSRRGARVPAGGRGLVAAALGLSTLGLSACGIATENYLHLVEPARPEWRPPGISLASKATCFEMDLARFLSPEGLLVYRQPAAGGFEYQALADCCIWTGVLLGAEALRLAAGGDEVPCAGSDAAAPGTSPAQARERVLHLLGGLERLHAITGVRGLLARNAVPPVGPGVPVAETGVWYAGRGEFAGWRWKGDVSKDQYAGALFGLQLAYRHVRDPSVRARVRALATAIADHLLEHDFELTDPGGETTSFGNLNARIFLFPVGINAMTSLAALRLAAWTSGEARYADAYQDLVERGWPGCAYWSKVQFLGWTNYSNDNMSVLLFYTLLCMEDDPAVRVHYQTGLGRLHEYVRREGNSLFNLVAAVFGHADPLAIEEARRTLELFPLDRRNLSVDLSDDPRIEAAFLPSRKGEDEARYPLPVHWRRPSSFLWRNSPYELARVQANEGEEVYSGSDYLIAYWLGRYHGFLGARE